MAIVIQNCLQLFKCARKPSQNLMRTLQQWWSHRGVISGPNSCFQVASVSQEASFYNSCNQNDYKNRKLLLKIARSYVIQEKSRYPLLKINTSSLSPFGRIKDYRDNGFKFLTRAIRNSDDCEQWKFQEGFKHLAKFRFPK